MFNILSGGLCCEATDPGELALAHPVPLSFWLQVKIVDPDSRHILPVGATGELWLKSPSVAAGYWGQPELSREIFYAQVANNYDDSG